MKDVLVFTLILLAAIINGYFFNALAQVFNIENTTHENGLEGLSLMTKLFVVVIAAPILETALVNLLPNYLLKKIGVVNIYLLVFLPSIIFSLLHLYSGLYATMAFFGGLICNAYYVRQQNVFNSFIRVVILHSSYNLYGFLFVV